MEEYRNSEWQIDRIEALTEAQASVLAEEKADIKGHQVYFVDFGGYFGYSALVYLNGRHIKYANDYALHHKPYSGELPTKDALKKLYIEKMNRILFREDEFQTVTDYDDERNKRNYLHNYYGLQHDYVSIFGICTTEAEKKAYSKARKNRIYDPVSFAYYKPELRGFVAHHMELDSQLDAAVKKLSESYDYWVKAFTYEMWNHEYPISWQGDFDVIGCFGNVDGVRDYENREKLMAAAGFSEIQRKAYMDARAKVMREALERDY